MECELFWHRQLRISDSGQLDDEVIELRLLRVMRPHSAEEHPAGERFLGRVPEYRFAIHRRNDGVRVGRIHIRVTNDKEIAETVGHCGYAVDEAHRRNGYATRAIRLIVGLARQWRVLPLWVLIEPENVASRRAVERVGFGLADIVDTSPTAVGL